MSSEASAVIVAVRVRPFSAKEDPLTCTITVPESTTIHVTDVAAMLTHGSSNNNNNSSGGGGVGDGDGGHGLLRHAFAFDRVFWSIPPGVLPVLHPLLGQKVPHPHGSNHHDDGDSNAASTISHSPSIAPTRKSSVLSIATTAGGGGGLTPSSSSAVSLAVAAGTPLPCTQYPPPFDDQASVYAYIGPKLYTAAMAGYNACLFAYGQTGSGKSYSMIGEHLGSAAALVRKGTVPDTPHGRELGVMPRLSADLFALMQEERERDEAVTYTVEVSFLEIYCEKVRDLLAPSAGRAGGGGGGAQAPSGTPTTTPGTGGASYFNAGSSSGSLRIRQHPSRGPYVEGLTHVRVRDAEGVIKHLVNGLRDRATAETKMNEHSSRSHAILQLHITKVTVVSDDGGVLTRTRTSKVNLVDLAGSERVTQSGVTGERFEEARNINQSLSTLGRVIQQLSEKQAGKRVIPAYRDSVLTWLLSDSLGGNSKTIMLATVAPTTYCHGQTLNTLRFAGVAKKIINVATVNEDRQYQQVIAELRQQIVRLTLQLESGKASEMHAAQIDALRRQKDELLAENNALKTREIAGIDPGTVAALRKRVADLEAENTQLQGEKVALQQRTLTTTNALREDLANSRAEVLRLQASLGKKEAEAANWQERYRSAVRPPVGSVSAAVIAPDRATPLSTSAPGRSSAAAQGAGGGSTAAAGAGAVSVESAIAASISGQPATTVAATAEAHHRQLQEELAKTKKQLTALRAEMRGAAQARDESADTAATLHRELADYRRKFEDCKRELDIMTERVESTTTLLDSTQFELSRARQSVAPAAQSAQKKSEEAVALAGQLAQTREDYLKEKQGNVKLLVRVSELERERGQFRRQAAERRAEISELELMLLEETETAERYYLRMRCHRTISEVQNHFTARMAFDAVRGSQALASRRVSMGFMSATATPSNQEYTGSTTTPRHYASSSSAAAAAAAAGGGGEGTSPSAAEQVLHQSLAGAQTSWELLFAQLEYECMSDEAYRRAGLEQEALESALRLQHRRGDLQQQQLAAVAERLADAQEQATLATEEAAFYRSRASAVAQQLEEEEGRHRETAESLRGREVAAVQLEDQLEAAEARAAEQQATTDSLIVKLADVQSSYEAAQERCTELEAMMNDAQEAMQAWRPPHTPAGSAASQEEGGGGGGGGGDAPAAPGLFDVRALVQLKEKELLAALQEVRQLERQCASYREEAGAVHAQREAEAAELASQRGRLQQEVALLHSKLQQAEERLAGAASEGEAAAREQEQRAAQQQAMIATLRQSLEEETRLADESRVAAKHADAKLLSVQKEAAGAVAERDEMEQRLHLVEGRYAVVQQELEELKEHYGSLERQLMELRQNEPELYVMLERGLSEDTTAWLEKVKRERASLQKQKRDARQLNTELLAHIRDRNSHLRAVQQQLSEIAESSTNTSMAVSGVGGATRGGAGFFLSGIADTTNITDVATDSGLPSSIHSAAATPRAGAE